MAGRSASNCSTNRGGSTDCGPPNLLAARCKLPGRTGLDASFPVAQPSRSGGFLEKFCRDVGGVELGDAVAAEHLTVAVAVLADQAALVVEGPEQREAHGHHVHRALVVDRRVTEFE